MVASSHIDLLMHGLPQGPTRPATTPCLDPRISMLPPGAYYRYHELKDFFEESVCEASREHCHPDLEPGGRIRWDEDPPLQADVLELAGGVKTEVLKELK